jgi:hypothetical protein
MEGERDGAPVGVRVGERVGDEVMMIPMIVSFWTTIFMRSRTTVSWTMVRVVSFLSRIVTVTTTDPHDAVTFACDLVMPSCKSLSYVWFTMSSR